MSQDIVRMYRAVVAANKLGSGTAVTRDRIKAQGTRDNSPAAHVVSTYFDPVLGVHVKKCSTAIARGYKDYARNPSNTPNQIKDLMRGKYENIMRRKRAG